MSVNNISIIFVRLLGVKHGQFHFFHTGFLESLVQLLTEDHEVIFRGIQSHELLTAVIFSLLQGIPGDTDYFLLLPFGLHSLHKSCFDIGKLCLNFRNIRQELLLDNFRLLELSLIAEFSLGCVCEVFIQVFLGLVVLLGSHLGEVLTYICPFFHEVFPSLADCLVIRSQVGNSRLLPKW